MSREEKTFRLSPEARDRIEEEAAQRGLSEDAVVELAVLALAEIQKMSQGFQEHLEEMREVMDRADAHRAEIDRKREERRNERRKRRGV